MMIDPYRLVVFMHVLLFAYWLGSDLGVFICGLAARKPNLSDGARDALRQAGALIDMAPRTCLVLMVPVGLTLATNYGSPVHGAVLATVWGASLAWLWLVWQVHWMEHQPLGQLLWKVDFGVRTLVMAAFVSFGAWCLATGGPIAGRWLALKVLLFGLIVLAGIIVRILLLGARPALAASGASDRQRDDGLGLIRKVVFVIWGLVAVIAFLGIAKPF